jgi:hypothetical protein
VELTVETFALLQHNKKHAELKSREHMEHTILKVIEQRHGKEPLAELERQYHADMILAARRARTHKLEEERVAEARKLQIFKKLHPTEFKVTLVVV